MNILFYSPDSYGLGHVRRTVSIAERLLRSFPGSSALVLTGAPRAHYFAYPSRCDYLKLPSITKDDRGRYVSGELDLALHSMVGLRGRLMLEACRVFRPDVFLVDHSPRGLGGEVLPTLEELPGMLPRCLRVLGLRDVIDEPSKVRRNWGRDRTSEVLRRHYDRILVYGERQVFDPIQAYALPTDVASKVRFVGYIARALAPFPPAPRKRPRVLVTVGGGGDGKELVRAFLTGLATLGPAPPFESVVVTGPLMSPRKRAGLARRASTLRDLTLLEHAEDLPLRMADADLVVSMGGYNTVCELAALGARSLIVPRVFPRREQWLRARALAERGMVDCLHPEQAARPRELMEATLRALRRPRPERGWGLDLAGLDGVASVMGEDLAAIGSTRRLAPALGDAAR